MQGRHGDRGVHVVGRADGDRVKLLVLLLDQFAEVGVTATLGPLFGRRRVSASAFRVCIDIAIRNNLAVFGRPVDVGPPLPANANASNANDLIR